MSWNGTGKHPILNKTREEIIAMNDAVTEKHADRHADNEEKKPQPDFPEMATLVEKDAQQKQQTFVENLSEALSSRKS